jgi:predicted DNA-binding ribbon-helix-helix protein
MCEIFIRADPQSYASRTRSVRLHGVITSIRLENLFWEVLDEIARRDGMGVVQLIEKLYDELITARGEAGNFASFLRVSALRYEALMAHQGLPVDRSQPLRGVPAQHALDTLPPDWNAPCQSPFSSSARAWPAAKSSAPV